MSHSLFVFESETDMPCLYDTRCDSCSAVREVCLPYSEVEKQLCECGGPLKIIITQVNLTSDCTPTQGWDKKFSNAPKVVRADGSKINPGHSPLTAQDIGLKPDQIKRLDLK
jgi:hypothetical protein